MVDGIKWFYRGFQATPGLVQPETISNAESQCEFYHLSGVVVQNYMKTKL